MKINDVIIDILAIKNGIISSLSYPSIIGITLILFLPLVWHIIRKVFCRPKKLKKWVNKSGYYVLENGELEHRYIARQILDRKLEKNEVVHHMNGRRGDNRIANLCVMDWEEHEIFHGWILWKKKVTGYYPSMDVQRKKLREKFHGIILSEVG